MAELTDNRMWLVPAVAAMVAVLVLGLALYELGPSTTTSPLSSDASSSTLTSSTLMSSSIQTDINGSTSTCALQSLADQEAPVSIPMSQREAVSVAESSSQYKAITAGAPSVNFSGIAQSWTPNRSGCSAALSYLSVNFDMQAVNGSSY